MKKYKTKEKYTQKEVKITQAKRIGVNQNLKNKQTKSAKDNIKKSNIIT